MEIFCIRNTNFGLVTWHLHNSRWPPTWMQKHEIMYHLYPSEICSHSEIPKSVIHVWPSPATKCSHLTKHSLHGSLKKEYLKVSDYCMTSNPGTRITQYDIADLLRDAYNKCSTVTKAVSASTSIFTFNLDIYSPMWMMRRLWYKPTTHAHCFIVTPNMGQNETSKLNNMQCIRQTNGTATISIDGNFILVRKLHSDNYPSGSKGPSWWLESSGNAVWTRQVWFLSSHSHYIERTKCIGVMISMEDVWSPITRFNKFITGNNLNRWRFTGLLLSVGRYGCICLVFVKSS